MSADDEADEEYGNCVKKMRIGSNTNTNYRSRLKKIIEYFSSRRLSGGRGSAAWAGARLVLTVAFVFAFEFMIVLAFVFETE